MGVSKNRDPKMDGDNDEKKTLLKMEELGEKPTILGNPHI